MSHGSGGKATHNLVEGVFAPSFSNPALDRMDDAGLLEAAGTLAFTTDSYVVSPLVFPGGDIGCLAVHGTINDLAMAGAWPLGLSAAFILEEGYPVADLQALVDSMAAAARAAGVPVVTGDTKVVPQGHGDGVYITTAGIGRVIAPAPVGQHLARPGDRVLVSGQVGNHGVAVMLARGEVGVEASVTSDTAPLHTLVRALLEAVGPAVHCLKDPTRGGVATTLNEIALASEVAIALEERAIPVHPAVTGVCELLGLDPLTIANEGKLLAVVAPEAAARALEVLRAHPLGRDAAIIGEVAAEPAGMVFLRTDIGGTRVLDMLVGDPLPRIC
ncbi:MAG: hydrogenase expression/formation protein HypE [Firmicutes bacterium]|nr:hydrogenase expression/formation protein HypE [Bacillota bacterium]